MPPVYHFSEEPQIREFVPRAPLAHPDAEPFVYAIDEWHSPLYWLPRDCPRVCFWPLPATSPEDRERFFGTASGRMVIAIESGWYERLTTTRLYRYTFDDPSFFPTHDHGVYLSRETVEPRTVEPMGDLLRRLANADVELRLCPSLVPLGEAVVRTSLHFSLIRMRNARGWTGAAGKPVAPAPGAGDQGASIR